MAKITKRFKAINEKLTPGKAYAAGEAFGPAERICQPPNSKSRSISP